MKIRLYCDCPPQAYDAMAIWAQNTPLQHEKPEGYTRVAIDVDLPIKDAREVDAVVTGAASRPCGTCGDDSCNGYHTDLR